MNSLTSNLPIDSINNLNQGLTLNANGIAYAYERFNNFDWELLAFLLLTEPIIEDQEFNENKTAA